MRIKRLFMLSLRVGFRVAFISLAIIVVALVSMDFTYLKPIFENALTEQLGAKVTIGRIERGKTHPFKFKAFDIRIVNPQGFKDSIAGTIERGDVSFFITLRSFFGLKSTISLYSPQLNFEQNENDVWNWQVIFQNLRSSHIYNIIEEKDQRTVERTGFVAHVVENSLYEVKVYQWQPRGLGTSMNITLPVLDDLIHMPFEAHFNSEILGGLFGNQFKGVLTFPNEEDFFPLHVNISNLKISLDVGLEYVAGKLSFYNVNFNSGITSIKGQGYYTEKKGEVNATLLGRDLFVDDFILASRTIASKSFPVALIEKDTRRYLETLIGKVKGKVRLKFDNIYFNGARFADVNLLIRLKENSIQLSPLSFNVAGGLVFLTQSVSVERHVPVFTSEIAIKNVDMNELMLSFNVKNNKILGTLFTKVSFVTYGKQRAELLKNFKGSGFLQIQNGRFDMISFSQSALKSLPLREVANLFSPEHRIINHFTLLQTPFVIEKEKIYTSDITVFNPFGLGMECRGEVGFNSQLSYEGRYYFQLNNHEQYSIPFKVKGTLDEPKASLDTVAAAREVITETGQRFFNKSYTNRALKTGLEVMDQLLPFLP
ncbi:MAG TPA: hypothetical protein VJB34_06010 [Bdellovibrionota bacterium]|nr:hypothetical protein [Bdellovibrionota bacterium]